MTDEKKPEALAAIERKRFSLAPTNLAEAMEYAKLIAQSEVCPKSFAGRPGDVLVAVAMGAEIGLAPMQAIQNIAIINGRPTVWGDAALAVVQQHPDFESIEETISPDGQLATCKVVRRRMPPTIRTFSMADAKTAGLAGKQGPWQNYPKRMLQMRARGFAIRDAFADALKGLCIREEVQDYMTIAKTDEGHEIQMPRRKSEAASAAPAAPVPPTSSGSTQSPPGPRPPEPNLPSESPAEPAPPKEPNGKTPIADALIDPDQLKALYIEQKRCGVADNVFKPWLESTFGIVSRKHIRRSWLDKVYNYLADQKAAHESVAPEASGDPGKLPF